MQRPVPQLPTATKESSLQAVAVVLVAVAVSIQVLVVVVAVAVEVSIQAVALVVATVALVVSIEANPSLAIPQQQIGSAAESGNAPCCLKYFLDHR
jgi:putative Mn2+ efflux pump MntP